MFIHGLCIILPQGKFRFLLRFNRNALGSRHTETCACSDIASVLYVCVLYVCNPSLFNKSIRTRYHVMWMDKMFIFICCIFSHVVVDYFFFIYKVSLNLVNVINICHKPKKIKINRNTQKT